MTNKTTVGGARYLFSALRARTDDALAKLVLISLADRANDDGECWPSLDTIAEDCETTKMTVTRKLVVLENLGLITRIQRTVDGLNISNLYRLPAVTEGYNVVTQSDRGSNTVTPGVVTESYQGSNTVLHKSPIEPPNRTSQGNTASLKKKSLKEWEPSPKLLEWARNEGYTGVHSQANEMRDYFLSTGKARKDWDATFRNWLRRSKRFAG